MTILAFAASRSLDWQEVFNYLKGNGALIAEHHGSNIEKEWQLELTRAFPLQEDNSEKESVLTADDEKLFDDATKRKIEAEKANIILKNDYLDTALIDINPKQLTLDIIIRRLENDEIQLDPDFQRGADLWTPKQQSMLIESILVKLPLPAFYFDGGNDGKWAVVDGLQRLSAIKNFVVKKTLRLEGLDFLENLNDKTYDELPRPLHRRIQETTIFAFLIKPGTPPDLKYNIFKRINTGGLILTPQEIRHALNQGAPATLLKNLSELEVFKQATGYSLKPKRMVDRDYINRFIAFFLQDYSNYERGDEGLDGFLNTGMALITDNNKDDIETKFVQAMQTCWAIFGSDAFRKRYDNPPISRRKPLNKALFEVWSVHLAQLSAKDCQILIQKKDMVVLNLFNLLNSDNYFDICISYSTGNANRVRYRFEQIKELIQTVLTHP